MLAVLLTVSLIIGLLAPWIVYETSSRYARRHAIATAEQLRDLLLTEAERVMQRADPGPAAAELVERFLPLPDVQCVDILGPDGDALASACIDPARFARHVVVLRAPPAQPPQDTARAPVSVALTVQLDRAKATSAATALQVAAQMAVLTLLISFAMVRMARRMLSPLAELAGALAPDAAARVPVSDAQRERADARLAQPLATPDPRAPAEVHAIYAAVEGMRERLVEAQQALRAYARDLEDDLASKDRRLGSQDGVLRRALADAEAAVLAKDLFIANASHELRTPLQAIVLNLRLADLARVPSDMRESMGVVSRSAAHLLELIDQLLDVSRSGAQGVTDLRYSRINLTEFLEDVRATLSSTVQPDNDLSLSYGGEPCECVCDPLRLRQIIINLVRNADAVTRCGRIEIALARDADPARLLLSVSDTGPGISCDTQAHLFELFYQGEVEPSREASRGFGIGLYLTRAIADALGGTIAVHTTLGAGSRFAVSLPIVPSADHAPWGQWSSQTPARAPHAPRPASRPLRILLAEDEVIIRTPLVMLLREAGMVVDVCVDGSGARARIAADLNVYDALVFDNRLPGATGAALLQTVREEYASPVPVIMLTGTQSPHLSALCKRLHARVLLKPIAPEDLIGEILNAVAAPAPVPTPDPLSSP